MRSQHKEKFKLQNITSEESKTLEFEREYSRENFHSHRNKPQPGQQENLKNNHHLQSEYAQTFLSKKNFACKIP